MNFFFFLPCARFFYDAHIIYLYIRKKFNFILYLRLNIYYESNVYRYILHSLY